MLKSKFVILLFLLHITVYSESFNKIASYFLLSKINNDYGYVKKYKNSNYTLTLINNTNYIKINNKILFSDSYIYFNKDDVIITKELFEMILDEFSHNNIKYYYVNEEIVKKETNDNSKYIYSMKPDNLKINAIVIDPGHGGEDGGAFNYLGSSILLEKDINLSIAKKLEKKLKETMKDKKVFLTRNSDYFITLEQRSNFANKTYNTYGKTLFISIHTNSSLSPKPYGFEVYYINNDYYRSIIKDEYSDENIKSILNSLVIDELYIESKELALSISKGLNSSIGDMTTNRGIFENKYFVVRNTNLPAVLVEVGFISNKTEAKRLTSDDYLNKIVTGIYQGIRGFINNYENRNR